MILVTYEELVKLVWLVFKLMLVVKLVGGILFTLWQIPVMIGKINDNKRKNEEMKIKMAKEKIIGIDDRTAHKQSSNYRSTSIGFVTTKFMDEKKESS